MEEFNITLFIVTVLSLILSFFAVENCSGEQQQLRRAAERHCESVTDRHEYSSCIREFYEGLDK